MDLIGDCIDHRRKGNHNGYGVTSWPGNRKRTALKHRVVMANKLGVPLEAISGKVVRHKCDNPRCINPDHLELGTQLDNVEDARKRGRVSSGSRHYKATVSADLIQWVRDVYVKRSKEYNQYALAKKLGVSRSCINNWLNDYTRGG